MASAADDMGDILSGMAPERAERVRRAAERARHPHVVECGAGYVATYLAGERGCSVVHVAGPDGMVVAAQCYRTRAEARRCYAAVSAALAAGRVVVATTVGLDTSFSIVGGAS